MIHSLSEHQISELEDILTDFMTKEVRQIGISDDGILTVEYIALAALLSEATEIKLKTIQRNP